MEGLSQNALYFMVAVVKLLSRKAIPPPQYMKISVFPYPLGIINVFLFLQIWWTKKIPCFNLYFFHYECGWTPLFNVFKAVCVPFLLNFLFESFAHFSIPAAFYIGVRGSSERLIQVLC